MGTFRIKGAVAEAPCGRPLRLSVLICCCLQGLVQTPDDAWAAHSVAHVYEMRAEVDKGLSFFQRTEKDWQVTPAALPLSAALK